MVRWLGGQVVDRAVHVVGTRTAYCSLPPLPPQVILHTDHCAKKLLPWMDGMLSASERYYETHGEPLFSSRGQRVQKQSHPQPTSRSAAAAASGLARGSFPTPSLLLPGGSGRASST